MDNIYPPSAAVQLGRTVLLPPRGVNNVFIVVLTSLMYDFATNLDEELDYLMGSRMTLAKGLFLGCRYIPFVLCALHIQMALSQSIEACPGLSESNILFLGILLICAECIFVQRTYTLWNYNRRVLIALSIFLLGLLCGTVILVLSCGLQLKTATFAQGCSSSSSISPHFIIVPYIFLLLLEIEVVGLTFYQVIRFYRTTRCRLLTVMTQYSVGYILAGLLFTICNIVAICFVPGDYGPVFEASQCIAQSLLVTRMQLELWKLERYPAAPTSYSNDQTELEFELPQRASVAPNSSVLAI
ncbi:hypothetical protein DEU56DRAFT_834519 [Suillus clintonianus]|uniref:uncharacterized protein n=1 Tax=Suillus clintonianus TaxID=1904413 RepID=UPI001B884578|nr:uncharacterized protein DEU56DRAFT_834519 [Suillus clintonianus]KAG2121324.1 hypothetical protein DEU56DRAFT_834519 [Suillus clintonianus]